MKYILIATILFLSVPAMADSSNLLSSSSGHGTGSNNGFRFLETEKQSRERQSAERYQHQQNSPYKHITGAPLGGYPEQLGSPAPCGTLNPGYTRNKCE